MRPAGVWQEWCSVGAPHTAEAQAWAYSVSNDWAIGGVTEGLGPQSVSRDYVAGRYTATLAWGDPEGALQLVECHPVLGCQPGGIDDEGAVHFVGSVLDGGGEGCPFHKGSWALGEAEEKMHGVEALWDAGGEEFRDVGGGEGA